MKTTELAAKKDHFYPFQVLIFQNTQLKIQIETDKDTNTLLFYYRNNNIHEASL